MPPFTRLRLGGWVLMGSVASLPVLVHVTMAVWARPGSAWTLGRLVDLGLVAASARPHTLIYLTLLATFVVTLLPGRDPVITALARRMYGTIPQDMVVYTRGVTWAWSGFFAAQLVTSLALFLWAPLTAWSFFVNVLNLPLIALMFAAEHAFRMVHLRNAPRHSFADFLRMVGYIKESLSRQESSG